MSDPLKGVFAMLVASIVWGLSGIYYKALGHIPPLEILSHRTIWSLVFLALVLLGQGRLQLVWANLRNRRTLAMLAASAILISANWGMFIFSIQMGWAMESSFGYYIFPLVAVALGFLALKERLSRAKTVAVSIAAIAVLTLGIGLGSPPWVSLFLAGTFGAYGLIKNRLDVGPVVSVFIEVLLLAPIALIYLFLKSTAFGTNTHDTIMLIFAGIITGGPLILMSYAARRISLSALGLVQYVNPTIQFFVATFIFLEPFTKWHAIAFPAIWVGLAIYTIDSWRQDRSARKRAKSVGTSSTT